MRCDVVVFTGDWVPDHELARRGDLSMDPGTRGPQVDGAGRTSAPGVFAAGNLLHGAETADVCALEGGRVGAAAARWARGGADGTWPAGPVPITCTTPLAWIAPNAVSPGGCRSDSCCGPSSSRAATLEVRQEGVLLHRAHKVRLIPNRPAHLSARWIGRLRQAAGPAEVAIG